MFSFRKPNKLATRKNTKIFNMWKVSGSSIATESRLFSESNDDHQRRANKGGIISNANVGCNLFFFVLLMVTSLLAISPSAHGAQLPAKRAGLLLFIIVFYCFQGKYSFRSNGSSALNSGNIALGGALSA